jgi:cyclopropane fatty-acyl-phospholipid synthase-like methyltransferase
MSDWFTYWNRSDLAGLDPLRQVGKTINGKPIALEHLDAIVSDIVQRLSLQAKDQVLDLCCGNGLITRRCSLHCGRIVGVDYSRPLIEAAGQNSSDERISYVLADVTALSSTVLDQKFDKIYMYEALQHLERPAVAQMLRSLRCSASSSAPVLLAGIPDAARIWDFYNTPVRREEYLRRQAAGTEAIGTWWARSELEELAALSGYTVEFWSQNPSLHTAHYRFDVVFRPIRVKSL